MLLALLAVTGGAFAAERIFGGSSSQPQLPPQPRYGSVARSMGGRGAPVGVAGWMGGRVLTSPYATTEVSMVESPWSHDVGSRSGGSLSAPGSRF